MKRQNIRNIDIHIDLIDRINLIKVDIAFMSNLLNAWDIEQAKLTHDDMFGMSRVCDSINLQLNECKNLITLFHKKEKS
jgi:hypothetical protein